MRQQDVTVAPSAQADEVMKRLVEKTSVVPTVGEVAIGPNERARSQYPQSCGSTPELYDER